MGIALALGGIVVAIVGILYGRRQVAVSTRGRLFLDLKMESEFNPQIDAPEISHLMTIQYRDRPPLTNLVVVVLSVTLSGLNDYEDPGAAVPPGPRDPKRPGIQFENFDILSVRTRNNDPNVFDIRLKVTGKDTMLFVNIGRLRAGHTAVFSVVGTKRSPIRPVAATLLSGHMKNTDVTARGFLAD